VTDTLFVASYNHHHHQAQYVKLFRIVFKTKHVPACHVDQQVKKYNQTEMESFADPRSGVRKRLRELVEKWARRKGLCPTAGIRDVRMIWVRRSSELQKGV
jgi:hypothetical protein